MTGPTEGSGCVRTWVAAALLAAVIGALCTIAHLVFQ